MPTLWRPSLMVQRCYGNSLYDNKDTFYYISVCMSNHINRIRGDSCSISSSANIYFEFKAYSRSKEQYLYLR